MAMFVVVSIKAVGHGNLRGIGGATPSVGGSSMPTADFYGNEQSELLISRNVCKSTANDQIKLQNCINVTKNFFYGKPYGVVASTLLLAEG